MRESARAALVLFRARLIAPLLLAVPGGLAGAGCSSQPQAPHGSPVLEAVWWVTSNDRTQVWSADPDAGFGPVPAGAGEVDFVFDRRIDGSRVEDTVGNMTVPKAIPPIVVSWVEAAEIMSDPPFADDVFYNSLGLYGGESSYVFLRPRVAGFPTATALTFALDASGLTSAYGEPMTGPSSITVTTDALGVVSSMGSGADGGGTFPPTFQLPIRFTGRPSAPARLAAFAHATADGQAVPIAIAADAVDPLLVYVSATCAGGWPAGARIEVSFDAGVPDAFGVPTQAPLTAATFQVSGNADAGAETPCAP